MQMHRHTAFGAKDPIYFKQQKCSQVYKFPQLEDTHNFYTVRSLPGMHNIRPAGQMWTSGAFDMAHKPHNPQIFHFLVFC